MIKHFFINAIIVLSVLGTASCEQNDGLMDESSRMVMDGYIDSDGMPEVVLTLSANPNKTIAIKDHIVRWGKVTLSDGVDTVILTGSVNKRRVPPYVYYSSAMPGRPGRRYTITAEYGGQTVSASCMMFSPTAIDSIKFMPVEGVDSLMRASMIFTAPDDVPAYYKVYARVQGRDSTFYPSKSGTVKVTEANRRVVLPVYRGTQDVWGKSNDRLSFPRGARVAVKLCRISEEVYDFYHAYENISEFGGGIFQNITGALPTNVNGGYGVWSAQGSSERIVIAE